MSIFSDWLESANDWTDELRTGKTKSEAQKEIDHIDRLKRRYIAAGYRKFAEYASKEELEDPENLQALLYHYSPVADKKLRRKEEEVTDTSESMSPEEYQKFEEEEKRRSEPVPFWGTVGNVEDFKMSKEEREARRAKKEKHDAQKKKNDRLKSNVKTNAKRETIKRSKQTERANEAARRYEDRKKDGGVFGGMANARETRRGIDNFVRRNIADLLDLLLRSESERDVVQQQQAEDDALHQHDIDNEKRAIQMSKDEALAAEAKARDEERRKAAERLAMLTNQEVEQDDYIGGSR